RLSLIPMVSAMAAGNTVVVKPSELPASTSHVMATMINEHFPAEYLRVVEGGVPETTALLQQKWDKIFFTGSTNVGKIVYEAAAKNLTPVTLELGGKNPAIVTSNTNLKDAAKRIIWSKFLNAGQTCITPDYILIDRSVEAEFLDHAKAYIQKFDYSFEHGNYVQIINDRNFQRLLKLLDRNKIFAGGEVHPETRYIAPTILTKVTFEDPIMQEEIFGPLLPVISYADLDDAFNLVVPKPKPLACYIFTHDARIKAKFLNELSFGGGAINDTVMHISNPHLPYGGVGESGTGSYQFQSGFATFSHYKAVLSKPFWFEPDFKYPPYTKRKFAFVKWLLAH
ncbi:MAG TPA: aldehyde dehydrogenase family protein, partial [Saprospiraceae bacterium]|nr:aldehyde dehydrogenase family protein [Saprospiraceae bacterium]